MKTKSMLVAALVLVSAAVFANEANDNKMAVVRSQESGVFKVIFAGEDFVRATVSVLDKKGNVVFAEEIQGKKGFILPMNFTGLSAGEYSIVVKQGSDSWTRTVNYATTSPVVKNSAIQNVHVSKSNDGKYLLSIATTEEQLVRVNIFDLNDALLHTEIRKANGGLAVVYDVKDATGEVKFQITDKAGYSKVIKK